MQVDPAALELELVDLAVAVVLAAASKARTSRSRGRIPASRKPRWPLVAMPPVADRA